MTSASSAPPFTYDPLRRVHAIVDRMARRGMDLTAAEPAKAARFAALATEARGMLRGADAMLQLAWRGRSLPAAVSNAANQRLAGIEMLARRLDGASELPRALAGPQGLHRAILSAAVGVGRRQIDQVMTGLLASAEQPLSPQVLGGLARDPGVKSFIGVTLTLWEVQTVLLLLYLLWLVRTLGLSVGGRVWMRAGKTAAPKPTSFGEGIINFLLWVVEEIVQVFSGGGGNGGQRQIVSQTIAVTPPNRARTRIGVGERVQLSLNPPADGPVAWAATAGAVLGNTTEAEFRAGDLPVVATVTATPADGPPCTIQFTVVAPAGVLIDQVAGTNVWHVQGQATAGFLGQPYLQPHDVSFEFIEAREGQCAAVATGYYAPDNGEVHPPGNWMAVGGVVPGRGARILTEDRIQGVGRTLPYSDGVFTWPIPRLYRVNAGPERIFATVDHIETINGTGALTISKGGTTFTVALDAPSSNYR